MKSLLYHGLESRVTSIVGRGIELPVDYNQALTVTEEIRRGRALEGEGVAWLEEPIRHDNYTGNAMVARALAVPVLIGENFNGPEAVVEALAARACDYVMPDAARIGGVSGWIQGGRHRCSARHREVVASAARDQRAPARREPDLPLSGVCRLAITMAIGDLRRSPMRAVSSITVRNSIPGCVIRLTRSIPCNALIISKLMP